MKKIIIMSAITCFLINNTSFGMSLERTALSIAKRNNVFMQQCNSRNHFNRAELLHQLEEQQHRLTPVDMISIKRFIEGLPKEAPCEPGKTKDRDFEHCNRMNKE